jgi:2Fe-2S ferredoxin
MPKVTFINADGTQTVTDKPCGTTLLRAAHDCGVDLEGACGGSLACATCHVVVHPDWFAKLPEKTESEEDMLDLAFNLTNTSRLGCQIQMTDELDGLVVTVPKT